MFIIYFTNSPVKCGRTILSCFFVWSQCSFLFNDVFFLSYWSGLSFHFSFSFHPFFSTSALVSALLWRSFGCLSTVSGWSIASRAPTCFPPSVYPLLLFYSSLRSSSLRLSTFWSISYVWSPPTQSSCLCRQGHRFSHHSEREMMRTCRFLVMSCKKKKTNWGLENSSSHCWTGLESNKPPSRSSGDLRACAARGNDVNKRYSEQMNKDLPAFRPIIPFALMLLGLHQCVSEHLHQSGAWNLE